MLKLSLLPNHSPYVYVIHYATSNNLFYRLNFVFLTKFWIKMSKNKTRKISDSFTHTKAKIKQIAGWRRITHIFTLSLSCTQTYNIRKKIQMLVFTLEPFCSLLLSITMWQPQFIVFVSNFNRAYAKWQSVYNWFLVDVIVKSMH